MMRVINPDGLGSSVCTFGEYGHSTRITLDININHVIPYQSSSHPR